MTGILITLEMDPMAHIKKANEDGDLLEQAIQTALQNLAEDKGGELAKIIHRILSANMERGRLQVFLERNEDNAPGDYVRVISECYAKLNAYVHQVQVEKTEEVWNPLFRKMQHWAYSWWLKHNFPPGVETFLIAQDCAAEAAAALVNAHFPFDTDFEAWAVVLVQYICLQKISQLNRLKSIPDYNLVELDEALTDKSGFADSNQENQDNIRDQLIEAIEHYINGLRKQVILMHYFDGLPFYEIAERLGRSRNAIYKAHFDALESLRKLLSQKVDIN
jgi:RNA polymerase sigma factor (sigma-70 family)